MLDIAAQSITDQFTFAGCLVIGGIFLVSSVGKVRNPQAFVDDVLAYGILPEGLEHLFSYSLISAEFVAAVELFLGWRPAIALVLVLLLLAIFLAGVGYNLSKGRRIACGCFGEESEVISRHTMYRLSLLFVFVVILLGLRLTGTAVPPRLWLLFTAPGALAYLFETVCLAGAIAITGAWLLNAHEVASVVHIIRGGRGS